MPPSWSRITDPNTQHNASKAKALPKAAVNPVSTHHEDLMHQTFNISITTCTKAHAQGPSTPTGSPKEQRKQQLPKRTPSTPQW